MVGANPAVVRAAILGMLSLLAIQVGRRQVGYNSLLLSLPSWLFSLPPSCGMLASSFRLQPRLGIMLFAEPFIAGFTNLSARFISREKAEQLAGPIGAYFLITLAAQITTLPLMVYYFKRLSLTSLLANPLILPAQPPLMILGGLAY